jgi:hypothetical protein
MISIKNLETLLQLAVSCREYPACSVRPEDLEDMARELLENRAERTEGQVRQLREALTMMYDKWENGISCREADESGDCSDGPSIGNAFNLSLAEEQTVLNLIVDKPADFEQACANCGKPYRAHLLHDKNRCSPNGDAAWFPQ